MLRSVGGSVAPGTVLVVDDDESVRISLRRLLEANGHRVRSFESAEHLLESEELDCAECAIVDLRMPGMSGLELQRALVDPSPDLRLVFLTACGDVRSGVRAIRDGAVDFLEKPVDPEVLLAAVERARTLTRRAREERVVVEDLRRRFSGLSRRECEVLLEVIAGKSNKQIAGGLRIVERTVKVHRTRIMRKTGFSSVAELTRAYCRLNRED